MQTNALAVATTVTAWPVARRCKGSAAVLASTWPLFL